MEKSIFDNIKYYADQRGLSLAKLAKISGIGEKSIFRWRPTSAKPTGVTPSDATLQKVADSLGVSIDLLKLQDPDLPVVIPTPTSGVADGLFDFEFENHYYDVRYVHQADMISIAKFTTDTQLLVGERLVPRMYVINMRDSAVSPLYQAILTVALRTTYVGEESALIDLFSAPFPINMDTAKVFREYMEYFPTGTYLASRSSLEASNADRRSLYKFDSRFESHLKDYLSESFENWPLDEILTGEHDFQIFVNAINTLAANHTTTAPWENEVPTPKNINQFESELIQFTLRIDVTPAFFGVKGINLPNAIFATGLSDKPAYSNGFRDAQRRLINAKLMRTDFTLAEFNTILTSINTLKTDRFNRDDVQSQIITNILADIKYLDELVNRVDTTSGRELYLQRIVGTLESILTTITKELADDTKIAIADQVQGAINSFQNAFFLNVQKAFNDERRPVAIYEDSRVKRVYGLWQEIALQLNLPEWRMPPKQY